MKFRYGVMFELAVRMNRRCSMSGCEALLQLRLLRLDCHAWGGWTTIHAEEVDPRSYL